MKTLATIFIISSFAHMLTAQVINNGWVFSGNGNQFGLQCHIDKAGNRYQLVEYTDEFYVDSNGHPIVIRPITNATILTLAIIKFDRDGSYLYHIRLLGTALHAGNVDIKFTSNDEAILCLYFRQRDSINLIDAKGVFYKTITPPEYNTSITTNIIAILLCKLNSKGEYMWANTIAYENPRSALELTRVLGTYITINNFDEIYVFFPNKTADSILTSDTLSVINSANQKNMYLISTKYVLLKFGTSGNLISIKEPLKNLFLHHHPDLSVDFKTINIITSGVSNYCIFRLRIVKPDTLQTINPIALDTGIHYILAKLNAQDSIVWMKKISREKVLHYWQINRFAYDSIRNEITFVSPYNHHLYDFYFNPNYLNSNSGAYICKLDTNGNILWEDFITGIDVRYTVLAVNYNYFTDHLELIGFPNVNDVKLTDFLPPVNVNQWNAVIAYYDNKTNKIVDAQTIRIHNNFSFRTLDMYSLGSPLTDYRGRTYITGAFFDSIILPCKKLVANIEFHSLGFQLMDGFVFYSDPITKIDTIRCTILQSPSLRHVWDSSGIYYDTLQNIAGCDSILYFNLTIGQSKRVLDTSVCYNMQSPGGRYVWDSSGTYFDTIPNYLGCDSIITVRLQVNHTRSTIVQSHCGPLASPSTRFVMDTTGVYKDTLLNQYGCDSILTINFIQLLKIDTTLRDTLVCSYFITQAGDTIKTNGMLIDTLQTTTGCDSIVRYNLHIGDSTASIDTAICSSYLSPSGKYIFTQAGTFFDTIATPNGCKLYYTIQITQLLLNRTIDTNWCGAFTTPSGKVVNPPGVFYDTIPNYHGCDSVLMLRIASSTILQQIDTSICNTYLSPSGNYQWFTSGVYYDTITNATGCDTVFEIRISLDTFSVRITQSNALTCQTPTIILTADAGSRFIWSPPDFLNATHTNSVEASPQRSIVYSLRAINATGCEAIDSISIKDERTEIQLQVANVFTPNNDGLNDEFMIYPQQEIAELSLKIYNRWGGLVFETENPNQSWNGKSNNGVECTAGVYYYIAKGIDRCGKPFDINGMVSLIR